MADLMQQAREFLTAAWIEAGWPPEAAAVLASGNDTQLTVQLSAIAAALRAAPEGGVPERTMMALATGWRRHAASGGRGRAVLIQCAESLEAAVIAARPQGVK